MGSSPFRPGSGGWCCRHRIFPLASGFDTKSAVSLLLTLVSRIRASLARQQIMPAMRGSLPAPSALWSVYGSGIESKLVFREQKETRSCKNPDSGTALARISHRDRHSLKTLCLVFIRHYANPFNGLYLFGAAR